MQTETAAMPPVVTQEEWRARRVALLAQEKELTKQRDRVNAARRRLPMVRVEKEYEFSGPDGVVSLADLFDGQRQLVIYHFMFDPTWDEGCPGCTGFAKALGDLSTLKERGTNFVMVSRAPLEKLDAYKAKFGWTVPWYSSFGSDFNYDYHATLDDSKVSPEYNYRDKAELETKWGEGKVKGEMPGISVFFRDGDEIYHTYSAYERGVEVVTDSYDILDLTPYGRQEDFEDSPPGWPQKPTYG